MLYISKLIKVVSSMYMDYLIYLPYVGTVCNSSLTFLRIKHTKNNHLNSATHYSDTVRVDVL